MPEAVETMPKTARGTNWLPEWFSGKAYLFSYAEITAAGFKDPRSFRSAYHYQARLKNLKGRSVIAEEGVYISAAPRLPEAEVASFGR